MTEEFVDHAPPPPPEPKVWCDNCATFSARVIRVDEYGDEIIHCRFCDHTWIHP